MGNQLSTSGNTRNVDSKPWRVAFVAETAFPLNVRGPVDL
jgi:hypothetical protein